MRSVVEAERILQLIALIPSRLRREALPADAGCAHDFDGWTALQIVIARPAAIRIEGFDHLILAGVLAAQLIDPPLAQRVRLGHRQSPVLAILQRSPAACHDAAERLDVLVQQAGVVRARSQAVSLSPLVVPFPQESLRS